MTREDIKQVAENYASQMCNDCSAILYCEGKTRNALNVESGKKFLPMV